MAIRMRAPERGGPITLDDPFARLGIAIGCMMHTSKDFAEKFQFGFGTYLRARAEGRAPSDEATAHEALRVATDALEATTRAPTVARSKKPNPSVPLRSRAGSTPAASTKRRRSAA